MNLIRKIINKQFVKRHKLSIVIIVFMMCFYFVNNLKPSMFYNDDGSLKQFGLGYKHKTVVPLWLFSILLAIVCFVGVSYLTLKN
tara:strand:- start:147 stop:401 length:255 start_codon:yes stop_codon:yes gene_type:complete